MIWTDIPNVEHWGRGGLEKMVWYHFGFFPPFMGNIWLSGGQSSKDFDQNLKYFDLEMLLWCFKGVVGQVPHIPILLYKLGHTTSPMTHPSLPLHEVVESHMLGCGASWEMWPGQEIRHTEENGTMRQPNCTSQEAMQWHIPNETLQFLAEIL